MNITIAVVLGTAREGRMSERVATFVHNYISNQEGLESVLVDVRDHVTEVVTTPSWGKGGSDEKPTKWSKICERADAFIFVVPEYNRGYPGEFKLLIDSTSKKALARKPAAMCGVSSGTFGGSRLIELIKPTLVDLKLIPVPAAFFAANVKESFTEDGTPTKRKESAERLQGVVDELTFFVEQMKK